MKEEDEEGATNNLTQKYLIFYKIEINTTIYGWNEGCDTGRTFQTSSNLVLMRKSGVTRNSQS